MTSTASEAAPFGAAAAPSERAKRARRRLLSRFATLAEVQPYLNRAASRFVALAGLAALSGFAEALTLLAVVTAALGVVEDTSTSQLAVGPFGFGSVSTTGLIVIGLVATIVALGLRIIGARYAAALETEGVSNARTKAFDAYAHSSWEIRSTGQLGDIQHFISTHADRVGLAIANVAVLLSACFTLVAFLISALLVSATFALISVGVMGMAFVIMRPLRAMVRRRAAEVAVLNRDVSTTVAESAAIAKESYVYGADDAFAERFAVKQSGYARAIEGLLFMRRSLPEVYRSFFFLILIGGLAVARQMDDLDLAATGGVILLLLRSVTYVQAAQTTLLALSVGSPFITGLTAEIERFENHQPSGQEQPGNFGSLTAETVGFSYDGGQNWALREVSLTVRPGESVAIVGPSGSGKSTLVDILLGLQTPTTGRLVVNGVDSSRLARRWWVDHVALVDQQPRLLSGTLRENITFFRPHIDEANTTRAARLARIDEVIEALPAQYETELGPAGAGLSGGQRQRIAIARSLAGRPELAVLDEPTSALDMESEGEVVAALTSLRADTTLIVVSHRPSILQLCDRVIVLIGGRIQDDGAFGDVRHRNVYFDRMLATA